MISVVIPAFNSERTISRAIESVLAQSYKNYEIIVVDDGSTDNTAELVKSFGLQVNYIYQENAGVSVARNTAIAACKGEWVAFLDSDDEWLGEKLELQMKLLQRNPQLCWCSSNWYHSSGSKQLPVGNTAKISAAMRGKEYVENYFRSATEGNCVIITTAIIVRRDILAEAGEFEPGRLRGQDIDMWWRIAHRFPQIGYIAAPLSVRYLDVENPVTQKHRLDSMRGHNRRKLVSRHLALAKKTGNIEAFEPFASKIVKEGLTKMLYCGYGAEARQTVVEFNKLLGGGWQLGVYVLTVFPAITSVIAKTFLWLIRKSRCSRSVNR